MGRPNRKATLGFVITAALGILGIIVPITWNILSNQSSLTVHLLSSSTLLSDEILGDTLKVYHQPSLEGTATPVETLGAVIIGIQNSGNRPIRPEDFIEPVSIEFSGEDPQVLDARIIRTSPDFLPTEISLSDNGSKASILPTLLNPSDSLEIILLGTNISAETLLINSRIAGIRRIEIRDRINNQREQRERPLWTSIVLWLATLSTTFLFLFMIAMQRNLQTASSYILAIIDAMSHADKLTQESAEKILEHTEATINNNMISLRINRKLVDLGASASPSEQLRSIAYVLAREAASTRSGTIVVGVVLILGWLYLLN